MSTLFTLDFKGILLALGLGVFLFFAGGAYGPLFFVAMLLFLASSALVTVFKVRKKATLGVYERSRGWKNVAANGVIPAIVAIAYVVGGAASVHNGILFAIVFLSAVAAITADKFSSELGVLDKNVFMLLGMKRVKAGTNGGVSLLGLAAGLLGAAIIAALGFYFGVSLIGCAIIILAGFIGDLADSLFGYFEEEGIGNKYTTNTICALVAVLAALVLILII